MDIEDPDAADLTVASVGAYLAEHQMPIANWFGNTGRRARSAWIDRDGSGWRVWDTDERADIMENTVLHTESESEALDDFLRRAVWHRKMDTTAVRKD
jgi:hypothetical protein